MKTERVKTPVRIDRRLLLAARQRGLVEAKSLRYVLEEGLRAYLRDGARKEGGRS